MAPTKVVNSMRAPNQCNPSVTSSNGLTVKVPLEEGVVVAGEEGDLVEAAQVAVLQTGEAVAAVAGVRT